MTLMDFVRGGVQGVRRDVPNDLIDPRFGRRRMSRRRCAAELDQENRPARDSTDIDRATEGNAARKPELRPYASVRSVAPRRDAADIPLLLRHSAC